MDAEGTDETEGVAFELVIPPEKVKQLAAEYAQAVLGIDALITGLAATRQGRDFELRVYLWRQVKS